MVGFTNSIISVVDNEPFHPEDVDECSTNNGGCEQTCTNEEGSFQCSCDSGFTLDDDGLNCNGKIHSNIISYRVPFAFYKSDVDECDVDNGGCDQICTNSEGSFQCSCNPGFVLGSDGFTCNSKDQ